MNYVDQIVEQLGAILDECPVELLRFYALLVLTQGTATTWEDVHNAWAVWRTATRPDHPDLIFYASLSSWVRELDDPYMQAIHQVAAKLHIREST